MNGSIIIKGVVDKQNINTQERTFGAWASVEIIDKQGDFIAMSEFRPALEKLIASGRRISINDSHTNHVCGFVQSYTFGIEPMSGKEGLYITAKIYNDYDTDTDIWNAILDGRYTGISLGGRATNKEPVCGESGCYNILTGIEIWEFSLVETPANQSALISEVNKLAKSCEIKKFKVYVKVPSEAPRGLQVYNGPQGGHYYETEELGGRDREEIERRAQTPKINVKNLQDVIGVDRYNEMDKYEEGQELKVLLNIYGKITNRTVSPKEINDVFSFIKERLPDIYQLYYKASIGVFGQTKRKVSQKFMNSHKKIANSIKNLMTIFSQVKDNKDKIIAIDNFINTSHTEGDNIIGRLWNAKDVIGSNFAYVSDIPDKYMNYLRFNKSLYKAFPILKYVHQCGEKWCVYSEDGKRLGTHPTKEDANKQLSAIEINKYFTYRGGLLIDHNTEESVSPTGERKPLTDDERKEMIDTEVNKSKAYIKKPSDAPLGVKVHTGSEGGYYYNTEDNYGTISPHSKVRLKRPDDSPIGIKAREDEEGFYYNFDDIKKARVYVKNPSDAPNGLQVHVGPQGGKFYETEEIESRSKREKVEREQQKPQIQEKHVKDVVSAVMYEHIQETNPEILILLDLYGKIARDKASDDEINKVHETIKRRLLNVSKFYQNVVDSGAGWNSPNEFVETHQKIVNTLLKLQNDFNTAQNRKDKIINIDNFMAVAHTGGDNVVSRLWDKPSYTGDPASKYLEYLRENKTSKPQIKVKTLQEILGDEAYSRMDNWKAGRELKDLLNTYTKISTGTASDEEINRNFDLIKRNLHYIYQMYANEAGMEEYERGPIDNDPYRQSHKIVADKIEKLENEFNQVKDRKDKIIAIDNFMGTAHTSGPDIIARIWNAKSLLSDNTEDDGFAFVSHYIPKYMDYLRNNIGKSIQKAKVYIKTPSEAPQGVKVEQGPKGGHYYESIDTTQEKLQQQMEQPQEVIPTNPEEFLSLIHKVPEHMKSFLSSYTPEEIKQKGIKTYITKNKTAGVALNGDEITNLFSLQPGEGKKALLEAIRNGGRRLDCFDRRPGENYGLPDYYSKFGFKEYKRERNWTLGGPDVVFMRLE